MVTMGLPLAVLLIGACDTKTQGGTPHVATPHQAAPTSSMPSPAVTSPPSSPAVARRPAMMLSRARGPVGTAVSVTSVNCPAGNPDLLNWHDSANLATTHAASPSPYRVINVRRHGTTATAVFEVLPTDHLGRGLLVQFCGGSGGNATADFDVMG